MRARVLVVEDELDAATLLCEYLETHGYEVTTVHTYEEGWAIVDACCSKPFEAMLADFLLGTRDVPASWKRHDELVSMVWPAPVLMVTGWRQCDDDLARRGISVMPKPASGKQILDWLSTAVKERAPTADESRLVAAYFTALEDRGWEGFARLCTEDVSYRLPGDDTRFAGAVTGRDAFRTFTENAFRTFQGVRYQTIRTTARPGYLSIDYRSTWSDDRTSFSGHGTVFLRLREGAICGISVRLDPRDIVATDPVVLAS